MLSEVCFPETWYSLPSKPFAALRAIEGKIVRDVFDLSTKGARKADLDGVTDGKEQRESRKLTAADVF